MTQNNLGKLLIAASLAPLAFVSTASAQEITHKIGGRVMIDYDSLSADNANTDFSKAELRRGRIFVSGKYGSDVKYKLELNTDSSGEVEATDAWVSWAPTGGSWNVQLGHFKTAQSLDEMTSSRFMTAIERSAMTDAFEMNRRLGIAVNASGDNYTLKAGIFGDNLYVDSNQEGKAAAARVTYTPVKDDQLEVQLGASFRWREIGETQSDLRYRQRTQAHTVGRILSTGRIGESDTFLGAEAAAVSGGLFATAEYGVTNVECGTACNDDPSFDGGYIEAGYFFGGKRTFKGGAFNRPKVDNPIGDGGYGAVSIFARLDTLDLTDGSVDGGQMDTVVLGADWWATKYTRISLNVYTHDAELGTSTSGLDGAFANLVRNGVTQEDASGFTVRTQFDF